MTKYGRNICPIKTNPRLSHSGPQVTLYVSLEPHSPIRGRQRGSVCENQPQAARSAPGAPYSGSYGRLETGHQLTPAEAETGTPAVRGTESSAAPVCAASPAAAQRQLAQVYIFQITDHSHRRYQTYANLSTARLFQGYVVLKTYHGKVGLA